MVYNSFLLINYSFNKSEYLQKIFFVRLQYIGFIPCMLMMRMGNNRRKMRCIVPPGNQSAISFLPMI